MRPIVAGYRYRTGRSTARVRDAAAWQSTPGVR